MWKRDNAMFFFSIWFWPEIWHGYFFVRLTLTSYISKYTYILGLQIISDVHPHIQDVVQVTHCTGCGHKVLNEVLCRGCVTKSFHTSCLATVPSRFTHMMLRTNLWISISYKHTWHIWTTQRSEDADEWLRWRELSVCR